MLPRSAPRRYEKELAELRNNPVEEGGDELGEVYGTLETQKQTIASKEREIARLKAELDGYKYTVD